MPDQATAGNVVRHLYKRAIIEDRRVHLALDKTAILFYGREYGGTERMTGRAWRTPRDSRDQAHLLFDDRIYSSGKVSLNEQAEEVTDLRGYPR